MLFCIVFSLLFVYILNKILLNEKRRWTFKLYTVDMRYTVVGSTLVDGKNFKTIFPSYKIFKVKLYFKSDV